MIFDKIKDIISQELDVDPDKITMDSSLQDDFDADSLDIVDIVMSIEDEFDVEIPDDSEDIFKTVGDVVRYVEENSSDE